MARYIDADELLTDEKTHTLPVGCGKASGNVVVFVDDIEKIPIADVVPKSEVESMSHKCEDCAGCTQWVCECSLIKEHAKTDVAREIFEEIEKILIDSKYIPDCAKFIDMDKFAELKKKYIPEETEEKDLTPEEVRKMSAPEVRANYAKIITSMSKWH